MPFETPLKDIPMTQTCKTVKVAKPVTEDNPTGYIVVNEKDVADGDVIFVDEKDPEPDQFDAMSRDELKAYLTSKAVEFAGNTGDAKLRVLCREIVK